MFLLVISNQPTPKKSSMLKKSCNKTLKKAVIMHGREEEHIA